MKEFKGITINPIRDRGRTFYSEMSKSCLNRQPPLRILKGINLCYMKHIDDLHSIEGQEPGEVDGEKSAVFCDGKSRFVWLYR